LPAPQHTVSMKDLLTSGVHFGHQTRRWNPKMKQFIFGERGGIYIIDLQKTTVLIDEACDFLKKTAERGGSVLFVGTKKQCQETIQEQAERVGMPYVSNRWLGGLLTNFATLNKRIKRMHELRELSENGSLDLLPTREAMQLRGDLRKLEQNLGGVGGMDRLPAAVFVVDPRKEAIVVKEARKLKIPIIGLVDTNCDPDEIDYIIPGNDDAIRSCSLIVRVMADAVAQGRQLLTEAEMKAEAERKAAEEAAVAAAVAAAEAEAAEQAAAAAADAEKAKAEAQAPAKDAAPAAPKADKPVAKKPEPSSEAKPAAKAEATSEPKAAAAPKADAKPAEPKPEKAEAKPAARTEAKPAAKAEPKTEAKPAEKKAEPKAEKAEPKADAKPAEEAAEKKPAAKKAEPKAEEPKAEAEADKPAE
jgi:small subunit ribosomal protein S2